MGLQTTIFTTHNNPFGKILSFPLFSCEIIIKSSGFLNLELNRENVISTRPNPSYFITIIPNHVPHIGTANDDEAYQRKNEYQCRCKNHTHTQTLEMCNEPALYKRDALQKHRWMQPKKRGRVDTY